MLLIALVFANQITLEAYDTPNDDGSSITLEWQSDILIDSYEVFRGLAIDGAFEMIGELRADRTTYRDTQVVRGQEYYYWIKAHGAEGESRSGVVGPVRAVAHIFNTSRINIALCIIVLFLAIIYYITRARRGEKLYIRKIPGITAMEEAIGRATEMGKPVLYVPGIMDIDEPETIAAMSILGRVAEKTAEYGTILYVPTSKAMVMTMAQQVVKEAAIRVGRPDWYNVDNIRYLTDDQFGYVSAVDGIMVREKPATNFYLGKFYAESLILAETGFSTGAIQIAGTALPDQLPFFVAACDYTLIGEELYAASAYLSQEPVQLGSLKGQDVGKLIFVIVILLGVMERIVGLDVIYSLLSTVQQ
ncbi:fibronectin type III domain-containing protein [candidate division WOR-3 bacterium]|nr:fibronectin type III domain-containing protein [candidate division WOR-3 bacterium]